MDLGLVFYSPDRIRTKMHILILINESVFSSHTEFIRVADDI